MSTSCPASPVTRRSPDAVSLSCPASPAAVAADYFVLSQVTSDEPPPETVPVLVTSHFSPERSEAAHEDSTTSSEPAVTVAAATDGHVSPAMPEESIIDDWEQLLSTMENASFMQFDSQTGIIMFEPSDTVAASTSQFSVDDHSKQVVDDAMMTSSEFQSSVAVDITISDSISEVTIDSDSFMLNGQSRGHDLTTNEFRKNFKRPFESEDEVINNKIRPAEADFDPLMSRIDVILEPSTVSSNSETMNYIENDFNDSINKIEKQSPHVNTQELETINLVSDSDSEESNLSEMSESQSESSESSESNVDSSIDDTLLHELPDELLNNTFVDLKYECYKKYPQLSEIINKGDLIFHDFENEFSKKNIIDNWMTEFNKKDGPSLAFMFNREKKWQASFSKMFQRLKESKNVIQFYEKYMKKCDHAQLYIVEKTDGLQVKFQSEKGENVSNQLIEHINEEDCDSMRQSCSRTIENENTKFIDLTKDKNNEKLNELSMDKIASLQLEYFATPNALTHPVPLPSEPKQLNFKSLRKLPPSFTLTVQNCPKSSDRKAIVLKWNSNINEEDYIEIKCYQIFCYQEISSVKPTSSLWKKLTEVHALPLPMRCTLSFESLQSGQKHYFAVRAVDKFLRLGPFSSAQCIELN